MDGTETRPSREFWVETDLRVVKSTGYQCVPMNPEAWWFPALGFSTHESVLFDDERSAIAHALRKVRTQRIALDDAERKLNEAWEASRD